ncbi:GNAT family N-acetyltransferase [Pedobacter sp. UYP1]|uniref:GNAT family N-acetyltransferase n=1 Tax=Pedobacter sp. UYP1 TaxID=1756396 RepID=UPI0033978C33
MLIIKYTPVFRAECIEIFKSNLPKFFAPDELQLFEAFLDHDTEDNYYVVQEDGHVYGCGGIFLDKKADEARLSWGMVHVRHHLKGIGKLFTQYRIDLLKKLYPAKTYRIDTSQHTAAFYEKNGFHTVDIISNGFGKGINKYIMKIG